MIFCLLAFPAEARRDGGAGSWWGWLRMAGHRLGGALACGTAAVFRSEGGGGALAERLRGAAVRQLRRG